MKLGLLIAIVFYSLNGFSSDWLCINNVGIEQSACLPIDNAKSCNAQGRDGLDCFWHYNGQSTGACYSVDSNHSDNCTAFETSYNCESAINCAWSGQETPIDEYEPEPIGVCAQFGNSSTVSCGSLSSNLCQLESDCTWINL